ncbi:MAG TPA: AIM24 family protein [Thermomicrobiaceae bacterium]|nr:AIM24 family protein [Thermomicrobiaceae bacterium]
MAVPVLLPTGLRDERFAGVTYHIEGELVPALQVELQAQPVYFEHYVLLWKDPSVQIGVQPLKGAFKRVMAGMPVFLTMATGPGRIAFSRDGAGHVFPFHLEPGQGIDVREHQFLAATESVEYGYTRVKGAANMLFGGTGFFVDSFRARQAEGVVWLHGYGNVFEITLAPGEQIDIEPGGWVYKEPSVQMQTQLQSLKSGLFGSAGSLVWNRFTGPGRIGLQSMYLHMPTAE